MEVPDIVNVEERLGSQDKLVLDEAAFTQEILEISVESNHKEIDEAINQLVSRINQQLEGLDSEDPLTQKIQERLQNILNQYISDENMEVTDLLDAFKGFENSEEICDLLERSQKNMTAKAVAGVANWLKGMIANTRFSYHTSGASRVDKILN